MGKPMKWALWGGGVLAVLLGLLLLGAWWLQGWLRSDDFRARAEREGSVALGVPLKLGRLSVDLWPLPAVAAEVVEVRTRPALTLGRVEVRPVWSGLLAGRLQIGTLIVREAVLPQPAIEALAAGLRTRGGSAGKPLAPAPDAQPVPWPGRVVLDQVTWVDGQGRRMTVDGDAALGGDGLLDSARFVILQGRLAGARGEVRREGDPWTVRVEVGGGRIAGSLRLSAAGGGLHRLQGELQTTDVEVSALTAPSKPLTGKLQAQTTLRAEFRTAGQIAEALNTQTRFTVRDALLSGVDLAKAVETVGLSRGGSTRLDTLAGQVVTQGRAIQLSNLVATSGALAAQGQVNVSPEGALSGRITVDLTTRKGAVGVPLAVGGTLDAPSVTLTRGAMIGAAIGTLVAPGAGTAAGATQGEKIGEKLKGLFGR